MPERVTDQQIYTADPTNSSSSQGIGLLGIERFELLQSKPKRSIRGRREEGKRIIIIKKNIKTRTGKRSM